MNQQDRAPRHAVYAGSFDPLTYGHLDIALRGASLFDTLTIAVYAYPAKKLLFSADERVELWRQAISEQKVPNIRVEQYTGLTVDYMHEIGATILIKGLRNINDFESEFQQGQMNHRMATEIETVCLFTRPEHLCISSSLIKEIAQLNGDIHDTVPESVEKALRQKIASQQTRNPRT